MTDAQDSLSSLEERLGYVLRDHALLEEALTHGSSEGDATYQRLEFLGDRVLGLVITDALYSRFPDEPEGDLSRRLAGLVRKEMLVKVAESIDMARWVRVAEDEPVHRTDGVVADVMEAVIGAVYKDGGIEVARELIMSLWADELEQDIPKDPKSALQELAQGRGLPLPEYRLVEKSGPDHSPVFTFEVTIVEEAPEAGSGKSKRIAETAAAEALLARMKSDE